MIGRIGHILYHGSKPLPLWLQNTLVVTLVLPAILAMMVWMVCRPAGLNPLKNRAGRLPANPRRGRTNAIERKRSVDRG